MTLPPSRLLIGLWQIRLLQHRLRNSTCWRSAVSSSFRSSVVSSASVASHAALLSGQGLAVCGECSFGLESNWSVLVSGNGSGWGLVSLAAGEDAVSGSSSSGDSEISYSVIGTSSDAPVTAPWASVDGLGADGFLRDLAETGRVEAQLLEVATQTMAEFVHDDVTVSEQLHVEVQVRQRLAVDQDLRHVMRYGAFRETRIHKTNIISLYDPGAQKQS